MKKLFGNMKNIVIGLGLTAVLSLALALLTGSFWYYEVCPAGIERVGLPMAEWKPKWVPLFWQPPEDCIATNAVRLVLGELGIMEDVNPRVPQLPG